MMSAKAGKRPLRSLTAHEKLEAIRRVHDGESKASVARDIGVPESTLRGWCKNEEKISYISRQSSPETDDSVHATTNYDPPKEKKPKIDETPYNLSLKPTPNQQRLSYSPGAEHKYPVVDYSKSQEEKPLNLKAAEKSAISERERNRAELARLSIELGLNRPEMYTPTTGNTIADISSNINLLTQWNNLLMQQQQQQQQKQTKKVTAPADTSTNVITSSQPLLTTYKAEKPSEKSPKIKLEPPKSVDESVWYWLKTQQAMLNLTQNQTCNLGLAGTSLPATNFPNDQNSSWFWKWYKQYTAVSAQIQQQQQQLSSPPIQAAAATAHTPAADNKQILYQQLTKDNAVVAATAAAPPLHPPAPLRDTTDNSENLQEAKPKTTQHQNGNKARAVLDNLLLNNNNNNTIASGHDVEEGGEEDESESQSEALEHGEKFLKWLECCSEPSVTAMQIMQLRGLINNIKTGVDRKINGDQQKTKVRRK